MTSPPRTLGIVPARGGSTRVPHKNLRTLGGRTLVERALATAVRAPSLDAIVLSSDDSNILCCAAPFPRVIPVTRPDRLATSLSPAIDYVRHALDYMATLDDSPFDCVVIVQPTSPFTRPDDIERTIDLLHSDPTCDSAVSVSRIEQSIHPLKLKTLQGARLVPYFEDEEGRMSFEQLPPVYSRNGAVYATRIATIQSGDLLGRHSLGYIMPRERSVDINDELDLALAEFLLARWPDLDPLHLPHR